MQAVILAGGQGTRLRPLTAHTPKPMVPLFDRPVMEHALRLLRKHGIQQVFVTLSYRAREIIDYFGGGSRWGMRIHYSIEDEPMGTAGGVRRFASLLHDTFLVISGDAVTDFDLSEAVAFHRRKGAVATMLLYSVEDPTPFGIVETDSDGRVRQFLEKPSLNEVFTNTVNTGIYVLEPYALRLVPDDQPYDFSRNLFPRLLANNDPFFGFRARGYWCDIGNLLQYRQAHFDTLAGRVSLELPAEPVCPGGWIGEGAVVDGNVHLEPPFYIGAGTCLQRRAAIGKHAVVGARCLVESEASIRASIVGPGARVGAGTCLTHCVVDSGA
ncbi:MAG: NDP-sugar synthase, partial [Armatimonadota bacterium]|nr:NDP-sugar synthase [Armatimonadota bacterium]